MSATPLTSVGAGEARVALVYRYVHHYRIGFYTALRDELARRGVRLDIIYGDPSAADASRLDSVPLPWGTRIHNRVWRLGDREVYWQPCLRQVWDADLVIVEQATKLLTNYVLLAGRRMGGPAVALWGHGHNVFVHRAGRASEWVKRRFSRHADWVFAYNDVSVAVIRRQGYPADHITCVDNAIDTHALAAARGALGDDDLAAARAEYGLTSRNVGVFSGSLYTDKRLDFLFTAGDLVRREVPDFELLVIGSGPAEEALRAAAVGRPWLKMLGPLYGHDLARAMAVGKLLLIPSAVGLAILDGFALELPLVTTRAPFQGHELGYLIPGGNGLIVDEWRYPADYAHEIARVLGDDALLERLQDGCRVAAHAYTLEAMTAHFADGVIDALAALGRRPTAPAARC
jgi:glycosyltransferase involved in cell wall biosynthesis